MMRNFHVALWLIALGLLASGCSTDDDTSSRTQNVTSTVRFAVIGDYGEAGPEEADVAALIAGWNPDIIITTGDNNYPDGAASTIDQNVGQYFHDFIYPYTGSYGAGATVNKFYPSLGNHDWNTPGAQPYLDYFQLPGNERYYDLVVGPVHFFAIDSDTDEPDGTSASSIQATWLRNQLAASTATWKIVYMHHPPYSSGSHGSNTRMQWPFKEWGATAVLAGHDHVYERLVIDDFPYFVNGLGGRSLYSFGTIVSGSAVRYNADYGAMLVDASDSAITFRFIDRAGQIIDVYTMEPSTSVIRSYQDGAHPVASYAGTRDTHMTENWPTNNYGGSATINIDGQDGTPSKDVSALVRWDISDIPAGSTVSAASVTFHVANSSSQDYEIYQLLRDWSEMQSTWNLAASGVSWAGPGATDPSDRGAVVVGMVAPSGTGLHTISLNASGVAMVQSWVNDPASNHGIIINNTSNTDGIDLSSRETADPSLRPMLTITYDNATSGDNPDAGPDSGTGSPDAGPDSGTSSEQVLIAAGSTWRYLDDGSDQGTAWRDPGFSDLGWDAGPAELGYGDGDEATVVSGGTCGCNKFITTYLRHAFNVQNAAGVTGLTVELVRDDGAVVYLNGVEVTRSNMPTGTITAATLASASVDDPTFHTLSIDPSLLVEGQNVLAVELHQDDPASDDISFDLALRASY